MKTREIYLIGICGIAMGTLAQMFREAGYSVRGSDSNVYPPMSDMLRSAGIEIYSGFSEKQVGSPDMVVIGNAISRGNPEVEHVLNKSIPYTSMAGALYTYFLSGKDVIAVAGTHGKSTTSALLSHILLSADMDPSYFVGGVLRNYNTNYRLGRGGLFVIEGDEYDSAFFEKVPKFVFYRPRHCVFTSLEFDHADIYRDLDEIELWFRRLVNMVPSEGHIVFSSEYETLGRVMEKSRSHGASFGLHGDYRWSFSGYEGDEALVELAYPGGSVELRSAIFGPFNYENIAAASAMALRLGVSTDDLRRGVASFQGVKRRQELIYSAENIRIYEDFAHHPTAIAMVLDTMRHRFPGAAVWAVYEPRSATSRRNVFQDELPLSFLKADHAIIKTPFNLDAIPASERIDAAKVAADVNSRGGDAILCATVDEIIERMYGSMSADRENIVILMSNGGFDGIYARLVGRIAPLFAPEVCCDNSPN